MDVDAEKARSSLLITIADVQFSVDFNYFISLEVDSIPHKVS